MRATWRPLGTERHGHLDSATLKALPDSAFAFPYSRKEPMTDAAHVRSAIARFEQVKGVSADERALALENLRAAAHFYDIIMPRK